MVRRRPIVYQVLTRLFGNENTTNTPWGSLAQNGCGKMADIDARALEAIRQLGATHVWLTGLLEHATRTDYTAYGIARDHSAVVKGVAGSAYAVKDYYDVDPDLAVSVPARMLELEALIDRIHAAGMGVLMDFVPNHVARQYHSDRRPRGVHDLGEEDDKGRHFSAQNDFYYFPGQGFYTDFDLCGAEAIPYDEWPARATGNDVFGAWAGHNDWYETVKLNYGLDYTGDGALHADPIPALWPKMLDILLFWAGKGVDGFRCDMAEMVPVEFWQWAIARVREKHEDILFVAEVYDPSRYRDFVRRGGFDFLYDKVGLYDTLREVMCDRRPASDITACWQQVDDIRDHMLAFLENHDEQRIASEFFAGEAACGCAAMLVAALLGRGGVMVYAGQELGERGMDEEGFSGRDGRTTIFDYWSVDALRRWRRGGYDGSLLSAEERALQAFYARVLHLAADVVAVEGERYDLMYANPSSARFDARHVFVFLRHRGKVTWLVAANFADREQEVEVRVPQHALDTLGLKTRKQVVWHDLLGGEYSVCCPLCPEVPIVLHLPARGGVVMCAD